MVPLCSRSNGDMVQDVGDLQKSLKPGKKGATYSTSDRKRTSNIVCKLQKNVFQTRNVFKNEFAKSGLHGVQGHGVQNKLSKFQLF